MQNIEISSRGSHRGQIKKDEGLRYRGLAAIRRWKAETTSKSSYRSAPFALEEKDNKTFVISRLTGKFFGNPSNHRFFGLKGHKMASLEIIP
jgi:hypothetical protein